MIKIQCERCGGTLGKWDSIGLDWVMYCINCGSEFYTRETELRSQVEEAISARKRAFVLRPRVMALSGKR